jgi:hypothetical protein
MNDISVWLTENWRYVAGAAAILGYLGWDKAKSALLKVAEKLKSMKSKSPVSTIGVAEDDTDVEADDVAAIAHLRNRAVEAKDEKLLVEIKSIAAKFFDIHTGVVKKDEV